MVYGFIRQRMVPGAAMPFIHTTPLVKSDMFRDIPKPLTDHS
jgi:hypothetical protein